MCDEFEQPLQIDMVPTDLTAVESSCVDETYQTDDEFEQPLQNDTAPGHGSWLDGGSVALEAGVLFYALPDNADFCISPYGAASYPILDDAESYTPLDAAAFLWHFQGTSFLRDAWSDCDRPRMHQEVPRSVDFFQGVAPGWTPSMGDNITTLMIRNVPNQYSRDDFVGELERFGLAGSFDFVYLPVDQYRRWNVGYAFVNFVSSEDASMASQRLTDHPFRHSWKGKLAKVSSAHLQGLRANLEHYCRTTVINAPVEGHRPLVLGNPYVG